MFGPCPQRGGREPCGWTHPVGIYRRERKGLDAESLSVDNDQGCGCSCYSFRRTLAIETVEL
jgi:hypothetical protein